MNADGMNGNGYDVNQGALAVLSLRQRPLPPYPTDAFPGTDEKIEVMRKRYARGYHLHHPDDKRLNSDRLVEARYLQMIELLSLAAEMRESGRRGAR